MEPYFLLRITRSKSCRNHPSIGSIARGRLHDDGRTNERPLASSRTKKAFAPPFLVPPPHSKSTQTGAKTFASRGRVTRMKVLWFQAALPSPRVDVTTSGGEGELGLLREDAQIGPSTRPPPSTLSRLALALPKKTIFTCI